MKVISIIIYQLPLTDGKFSQQNTAVVIHTQQFNVILENSRKIIHGNEQMILYLW